MEGHYLSSATNTHRICYDTSHCIILLEPTQLHLHWRPFPPFSVDYGRKVMDYLQCTQSLLGEGAKQSVHDGPRKHGCRQQMLNVTLLHGSQYWWMCARPPCCVLCKALEARGQ